MNADPMDWREALETVVAATKQESYRRLCADDHPQRDLWRARMIAKATGAPSGPARASGWTRPAPAPSPPQYPSLPRQAANLADAVGRIIAAAVQGEAILAPADIIERRDAICVACEFFDHTKRRCTRCGCTGAKLHLAAMACPLDPPRWTAVTSREAGPARPPAGGSP